MAKNVKHKTVEFDLQSAIETGYSEIDCLHEEMDNWASSLEGSNLANSDKCSVVREAADTLGGKNEPEIPACMGDRQISWSEGTKAKNTPRWLRCANAISALESAVADAQQWIEENPIPEDDESKETNEELKANHEAVESFVNEVQEVIDEVSIVEFPSMFG